MLINIAYTQILGHSLLMWLGILSFSLLFLAAITPSLVRKFPKIPFKLHKILGILALIVAAIHGLLALAVYF